MIANEGTDSLLIKAILAPSDEDALYMWGHWLDDVDIPSIGADELSVIPVLFDRIKGIEGFAPPARIAGAVKQARYRSAMYFSAAKALDESFVQCQVPYAWIRDYRLATEVYKSEWTRPVYCLEALIPSSGMAQIANAAISSGWQLISRWPTGLGLQKDQFALNLRWTLSPHWNRRHHENMLSALAGTNLSMLQNLLVVELLNNRFVEGQFNNPLSAVDLYRLLNTYSASGGNFEDLKNCADEHYMGSRLADAIEILSPYLEETSKHQYTNSAYENQIELHECYCAYLDAPSLIRKIRYHRARYELHSGIAKGSNFVGFVNYCFSLIKERNQISKWVRELA